MVQTCVVHAPVTMTAAACPTCNGTGVVEYDSPDRAVDAGPDVDPVYTKRCEDCGGSGEVPMTWYLPLPTRTTPLAPRTRPHVGRSSSTRRRGGQQRPRRDVVIRVPLGLYGRTYAYVCREPVGVGDYVEVEAAVAGVTVVPVVGFGRNGYAGPLKRAVVIR